MTNPGFWLPLVARTLKKVGKPGRAYSEQDKRTPSQMRTGPSTLIIGCRPHQCQTLAQVGWRTAHTAGPRTGFPRLQDTPAVAAAQVSAEKRRGRCRTLDPRPEAAKGAGEWDRAEGEARSPGLCPPPVRNTDWVFGTKIQDLNLRSSVLHLQEVGTEKRISLTCIAQIMKLPIRRKKSAS